MNISSDENYIFHEGFKHVEGVPCEICKKIDFDVKNNPRPFYSYINIKTPKIDIKTSKEKLNELYLNEWIDEPL